MIRYLISRLLLPLLLFLLVRYFFRDLFAPARRSPERASPPPPTVPQGGELKKDPVCGTFVSTVASVQQKVKGEMVYFCSTDCRDRYKG